MVTSLPWCWHYVVWLRGNDISEEPKLTFKMEETGSSKEMVEASWNVMAHVQKPHFIFQRNGRVHLNRPGRQFSRLLAAKVCVSAVVMLDTPCSEVVWRVLATHSICQFPLHFTSRASPYAITFQLESTYLPTYLPVHMVSHVRKLYLDIHYQQNLKYYIKLQNQQLLRCITPPTTRKQQF
jgi:hypothetical protein